MKHTDKIIKYLSGELDKDERKDFIQQLEKDRELKEEYQSITEIWEMLHSQLKISHVADEEDREARIAEILAEHDIANYAGSQDPEAEKYFRKNLQESMQKHKMEQKVSGSGGKNIRLIGLLAAAAALILLLVIIPGEDIDSLSESYYHPVSDPAIVGSHYSQRGDNNPALMYFKQGNFELARKLSAKEWNADPKNSLSGLIYAISSYETGNYTEAEESLNKLVSSANQQFNITAEWYLSLIYIKSERHDDARARLEKIAAQGGTYEKKASKLLRKLN